MNKQKRMFSEWCPLCCSDNEFTYVGMRIYKCRVCGFALIPCSMCNTNITRCDKCRLSDMANRKNQVTTDKKSFTL